MQKIPKQGQNLTKNKQNRFKKAARVASSNNIPTNSENKSTYWQEKLKTSKINSKRRNPTWLLGTEEE